MGDRSCFEDLSVGQLFYSSSHMIDACKLRLFAEEFDPQPFYLEVDAAASSVFSRPCCQRLAYRRRDDSTACKGRIARCRRVLSVRARKSCGHGRPASGDELKGVSEVDRGQALADQTGQGYRGRA